VEHPENVAGFSRKGRGDFSIGEVNTTLLVRDKHPLLILTGGSPCPTADHMSAMTAVRFICDTSVFGSGTPQLVAQLPPDDETSCAFFLEWRTHYACPSNEEAGFWGGLIVALSVMLVVLLMLYFVGGTLYNRYVLHLRGFDQIPRFSLFSFTDTLDCCQNCCDRFAGTRAQPWHEDTQPWTARDRHGPGFDRLPTLPEEEEGLVGAVREPRHTSLEEAEEQVMHGEEVDQGGAQAKDMDARGVIRL